MINIGRRLLLKGAGIGAATAAARTATAAEAPQASAGLEFNGMLLDITKCIGCRNCEAACNEANELPEPKVDFFSTSVFAEKRDTTPDAFTVLNKFPNQRIPEKPLFVRTQCMHCNQPACASGCLTKAMEKTPEGPVVYHPERCMGCRYCMVACPFDVPKFQYNSAAPFVRKCDFCAKRQKAGQQPLCAENCPTGATLFGKKRDLLEIARARIYAEPDKYNHQIYGEHEAGGTGWLYLLPANVKPEAVGLRTNLGTTPYPELTSGFLYGVPLIFVLWPSLLFGLSKIVKGEKEEGSNGHD